MLGYKGVTNTKLFRTMMFLFHRSLFWFELSLLWCVFIYFSFSLSVNFHFNYLANQVINFHAAL